MKRLLLLSLIFAYCKVNAQTNTFPASGRVGIGLTSPTTSLDIISPNYEEQVRIRPAGGGSSSVSVPSIIDFFSTFDKFPSDQGPRRTASIKAQFSGGAWGWETLSFHVGRDAANDSSLEPFERMRISGNGNVGIGTTNPTERLSVKGKIRAQEVKVELANWPDYVFTKNYKLPTLTETEIHIKEKGHLPGIPSAAEVKENGVELGDMNKKLLQKIEELTLHLIEMEKEVKSQRKEIDSLKQK